MKTKFIFFILTGILFVSCNNNKQEASGKTVAEYTVKYAQGFAVKKYDGYTEVTVKDPWDSTRILQKYILVGKDQVLPELLPQGTLVRTPLSSAAVYSTIHCSVLRVLGSQDIVKAVCEPEYVSEDFVKEGLSNGTIIDLGMASNPDVEKLILLDPEAVMTSPIQGVPYGRIEKTGIPIIEVPDYMEATPLGRAEWVRFYSLFIGKETVADSLFASVEKEYNAIKEKVGYATNRPTVFTDLKYGSSWYIAGGNSFVGNMLKDAGAAYIWADDKDTGAKPLTFETILDKAGEADFWLVKYNQPQDMTYKSLEKEYKPYSYFAAFKNRNIYECNTGKVTYYEDLPIHPEYLLKDMAAIFHPGLFQDYQPVYYKKMAE